MKLTIIKREKQVKVGKHAFNGFGSLRSVREQVAVEKQKVLIY